MHCVTSPPRLLTSSSQMSSSFSQARNATPLSVSADNVILGADVCYDPQCLRASVSASAVPQNDVLLAKEPSEVNTAHWPMCSPSCLMPCSHLAPIEKHIEILNGVSEFATLEYILGYKLEYMLERTLTTMRMEWKPIVYNLKPTEDGESSSCSGRTKCRGHSTTTSCPRPGARSA